MRLLRESFFNGGLDFDGSAIFDEGEVGMALSGLIKSSKRKMA